MTKTHKLLCYAIWFGFPLTLAVFSYVGLTQNTIPTTSRILPLHMVFFTIVLASTGFSIFLSSKLYTSVDVYRHPLLVKLFAKNNNRQIGDANFTIYFQLYTIALACAETCSLFGLVSLLITGNISFFFIMIALSLIGWIPAYPKLSKLEKLFMEI